MPNDYLIDCHKYITRELSQAETLRHQAESRGDTRQVAFHSGQIEELSMLRGFLSEHFDLTTQQYF
ncbi:MAG: hypothetical protein QNJ01_10745 [Desulfobacterales bacterium]|nr:hypothetical protein [Desulfobacterales bacterium]